MWRVLAGIAVATTAHADLRKADLRPAIKQLNPKLARCYDRLAKKPAGVVNTKLTVVSEQARLVARASCSRA